MLRSVIIVGQLSKRRSWTPPEDVGFWLSGDFDRSHGLNGWNFQVLTALGPRRDASAAVLACAAVVLAECGDEVLFGSVDRCGLQRWLSWLIRDPSLA